MAIKHVRKSQIKAQSRAKVGVFIFNEALTKVLEEYSDYSDIFSAKNGEELSKNSGINKYVIKLEKGKQLFFGPIYSLGLVEFETLQTYIKTNLAIGFIHFFKSLVRVPIFFDWK